MPASPNGPHPTAIDLFCGVGGLSLGLTQGGFHLLGAVDNDQHVLDVHCVNFPSVKTVKLDLFTVPGGDIVEALGLAGRRIDLLAGGPPCQGFSIGGVLAKRDPRNHGVIAFARIVAEIRPRYFLMENVRGFLFQDHEGLRNRFCRTIRSAGYRMWPFKLLNAADYGVPQRRLRAFVVGVLGSDPLPECPKPCSEGPPTVRDAIGDLTAVDANSDDFDADEYMGELGPPSVYVASLRRRGRPRSKLTGCLRTKHSEVVVDRFRATAPGQQEPVSRFFRLCWNGISPTIRAGTGPEHGSYTAPRPIHPEAARCITVREAARLHSFPDWFEFGGTRWNGFRWVGNSVPPFLARAVANEVRRVIG